MILTILLIIIYIAFISLGLPDSLLGSAWPTMYKIMGVPISYAGIISMIIAGCTIISSLLTDRLIKRFGTGIVTTNSVLMTAFALLGFSITREFYILCLLAIPLGLGAGSVDAALNNFVALHYQARHMNFLHSFWGVGAMTGPIIMAYYLERGYLYQLGYRAVAIIQFSLVLILILSLPFWRKYSDKRKNNINGKDTENLSIGKLIKIPGVKQVLIAFLCYCSIEMTMGLWGSSFMVLVHGIASENAANWTTYFFLGLTCGRFLSGFLTVKFTSREMVYLGMFFIVVGIIMLMIPISQLSLLIGFIIIGIGLAPFFPSLIHQTPENFGKEYSQSIMGLQMASAYVGTTFVPPLFGALASSIGYEILPFFVGILLTIMLIMIKILYRKVDLRKINEKKVVN